MLARKHSNPLTMVVGSIICLTCDTDIFGNTGFTIQTNTGLIQWCVYQYDDNTSFVNTVLIYL